MNKNRRIIIFIICIILLLLSKPIYGNAFYEKSEGNVLGMEEWFRFMKQDFLYLNEEIECLYKECEQ